MDYREQAAPEGLSASICAQWSLDCGRSKTETIEHQAVPDGCIELIWRTRGRSFWHGEQPAAFVCGLLSKPAALRFSGDASFTALRLWPWVTSGLGLPEIPSLIDGWAALPPRLHSPEPVLTMLTAARSDPIGEAVLGAQSVAQIAVRADLSPRQLQRWFAARVGVPPRQYLRLVRFQEAFAGVQSDDASLAVHAADHGYADQAHMARAFRALAKASAYAVRRKAKGPFV